MALKKKPKYDLRRKHSRYLEIGLIFSLLTIIVAFKYFPNVEKEKIKYEVVQELIDVEDVGATKQETHLPPPPKPLIPIEASENAFLEDMEIDDTELFVDEDVIRNPPPLIEKVDEEGDSEPVFFVAVEEMPNPIGGIKGIMDKVIYPEIAKRAGVHGRVYIKAFVDEKGKVTRVDVIKGIGAGCDEAAVAAVMATHFNPGKQRGKPVKVQVSIPIRFKLIG